MRKDGSIVLYLFLSRTFMGAAIRAVSQDRELMRVDTKKIYLITSAIGGGLAGVAACLLVLQYVVHPDVGLSFGPIIFIIFLPKGILGSALYLFTQPGSAQVDRLGTDPVVG